MAVEQLQPNQKAGQLRPRSELSFPAYNLADSLHVAERIHKDGGGSASADHLSSYLGYKSTNNGSYLARVGASRAFGLVSKNGNLFVPTSLALSVLTPVYDVDSKKALAEAFLNVPLFKKVYGDFKGKELPPEFGMKNALRLQYGVVINRLDLAYRMLMESAEQARFFETRNGAKTHLILPTFPSAPNAVASARTDSRESDDGVDSAQASLGGRGGGGDDGNGNRGQESAKPRTTTNLGSMGDVKARYVETLIKLFEDKSAKGEIDEKLMERIERLLEA